MLHAALLSATLMLSLSVRTPNEQPNPLDYEVATGVEMGEKKQVESWHWTERENGQNYTGTDNSARYSNQYVVGNGFFVHRQAQDVLRGGVSVSYEFLECLETGVLQSWDHYDPATALHLGINEKVDNLRFGVNINVYGDGIESMDGYIDAPIKVSKCVSVGPMAKYSMDRNGNEFAQAKVVLRVTSK